MNDEGVMKKEEFIDHIDRYCSECLDDDAIKHKTALVDEFDKLHKEMAYLRLENTVIYKKLEELKQANRKRINKDITSLSDMQVLFDEIVNNNSINQELLGTIINKWLNELLKLLNNQTKE